MAEARKNGLVKLKIVVEKLQRSLLPGKKTNEHDQEAEDASIYVPGDVKEGHFAVIAVEDEDERRFLVPLSYLKQPRFLRLLELAAEEYGFDREGVLTVPCRPSELERILAQQHN